MDTQVRLEGSLETLERDDRIRLVPKKFLVLGLLESEIFKAINPP